jgi:hypothetical protein
MKSCTMVTVGCYSLRTCHEILHYGYFWVLQFKDLSWNPALWLLLDVKVYGHIIKSCTMVTFRCYSLRTCHHILHYECFWTLSFVNVLSFDTRLCRTSCQPRFAFNFNKIILKAVFGKIFKKSSISFIFITISRQIGLLSLLIQIF